MSSHSYAMAFESAFGRLQVLLEAACAAQQDWAVGVAAAIHAAFELAAAEPELADLLTNETLSRGIDGTQHHRRLVTYIAGLLAPGRDRRPIDSELPQVLEEALTAGLAFLVGQRLDQGRAAELPAIAPDAIEFVLTPYLGARRARQIARP